jgi:hypothetical protein
MTGGPWALARLCEEQIEALEGQKPSAPPSEKRAINKRLHMLKQMRRWCMTRAGYVDPAIVPERGQ